MPNPILPRNEADPTGLAPTRRRADTRLTKMMQIAARDIRVLSGETAAYYWVGRN